MTESTVYDNYIQCPQKPSLHIPLTNRAGLGGELGGVTIPPDKGRRIQEHRHGAPDQNSSGNGSSKASLVQMAPGCKPGTRGVVAPAMGTMRASGVLPAVRMISVPAVTNNGTLALDLTSASLLLAQLLVI